MPILSAVRVRDAKPREKPYKLFDERGLHLLVMPSADQHRGRPWRFRYRHNGAEKLLALGIGREWLAHRAKTTATVTQQKATWLLEQIFAEIGSRPIRDVTAPELLTALRKIEARRHYESAHRAKQKCGQVFRYAIVTGRAERDISADLRGALVPVVSKNPRRTHRPGGDQRLTSRNRQL